MPSAALVATLNLLLLRAGPQDFPFDRRLSGVLVALCIAAMTATTAMVKSAPVALIAAVSTVGALAVAIHVVLRVRNLDVRFLQTWHSLLATLAAVKFLVLWPMSEVGPQLAAVTLAVEKGGDMSLLAQTLPKGPMLLMTALMIWNVAVWSNILRHALNTTVGYGILVALLVDSAVNILVGLAVFPLESL